MVNRRALGLRCLAMVALAGSALFGLAACSSANPLDGAVTKALGTSAPDIPGDGSVPSDYPTESVPLVAGKITSAVGTSVNGKRVWEVSVDAAKAFTTAVARLTVAGMSTDSIASTSGTGVAQLSAKRYTATVTGTAKTVLYVVTQR